MVTVTSYPASYIFLEGENSNTELPNEQATISYTSKIKMQSPTRELPMPKITKLSSLNQASATLLHCWTKLVRLTQQEQPSPTTPSQPSSPVVEDRRDFQIWLEHWELAFTAFLSNAMASMTGEDITHSRILKANHLACGIVASDPGTAAFDVFEAEFSAIVELAGAVLRSRQLADSAQESRSSTESPTMTTTLDVKEPLCVVSSRCTKASIRNRAAELLARHCL